MLKELDLVEEDDQITHMISLAEEDLDPEDMLSKHNAGCHMCCVMGAVCVDVFRPDPDYQDNEDKYKLIRAEILGEGVGSGSSSEEEGSEDSEEEEESESDEGAKGVVRGVGSRCIYWCSL